MTQNGYEKRKQATRQRILDAASDLFENLGFEGFKMGELPKAAQCSLQTVYKHFDSKEALLTTILDEWVENNIGLMDRFAAEDTDKDIEKGLVYIGTIFLTELFTRRDMLIRNRLIVDAVQNPVVGQFYFNILIARGYKFVADYIGSFQSAGVIRSDIPSKRLAEYYSGMLLYHYYLTREFNAFPEWSKRTINRHARTVAKEFVDAFKAG